MNEGLSSSLLKCHHSQNGWCTFDRMTERGHVCLTGMQCDGYDDSCPFKETPEDIKMN
ncbi:hypothetical protein J2755_001691 [Methanohalophilus levihalophilus]|nr:hypothetical protein [Methanohalophilus levihalophilus]